MQFMISRGVNASMVSAQGFGESDPVASNDTPEGQAKNRRVELTVAGN
jgi:chemotaxis protein MotB